MKFLIALVFALFASTHGAEQKVTVQQFSLADGRVLQAVRLIKIGTPKGTSYTVTLVDGTKVSFTNEDVISIGEAAILASEMPASLNPEPKPPVVVQVIAPEPPPPVEYVEVPPPVYTDGPSGYIYRPHVYRPHRDRPHHSPPPPPPAKPDDPKYAPVRTPPASDTARRAFSTIPSSPVNSARGKLK